VRRTRNVKLAESTVQAATGSNCGTWRGLESSSKVQKAQLPLREQGVSFVLSSHHNATLANLAILSLVIRNSYT